MRGSWSRLWPSARGRSSLDVGHLQFEDVAHGCQRGRDGVDLGGVLQVEYPGQLLGLMPMVRAMSSDFIPFARQVFSRCALAASEAEDGVYLPSKRRDALEAGRVAANE